MSAPFQKVQFFCLFGKKWIKIPPLSSVFCVVSLIDLAGVGHKEAFFYRLWPRPKPYRPCSSLPP